MFDLSTAKIRIYNFNDHKYAPEDKFCVKDNVLPYYVMSYIKKGSAQVIINGQNFKHSEGTVIILPPNVPHTHMKDTETRTEFLWWHFDYTIADILDVIKILDVPLCFELNNKKEFESLFLRYKQLTEATSDLCNTIYLEAIKLEILACIFKNVDLENSTSLNIPPAFMDIYSKIINCTNKDLSLRDLSKTYYMHPTYVSNRFKQYFGTSPMELKKKVLIDRAKALLKDNNFSVHDIAITLGYNEISTFTRFFTERVGISPRQYRKMELSR